MWCTAGAQLEPEWVLLLNLSWQIHDTDFPLMSSGALRTEMVHTGVMSLAAVRNRRRISWHFQGGTARLPR